MRDAAANDLIVGVADSTDADAVAAVRTAAANDLTRRSGEGHWSSPTSAKAAAGAIRNPHQRVVVARTRGLVVGTLTLQTKKPWAIDVAYFTPARRPIYLVDMAVSPDWQRRGIGRALLGHAAGVAVAMGGDAIRLDSFDADAGAGPFYAACGFQDRGQRVYKGIALRYFELLLRQGDKNDGETPRSQRGGGRGGRAMK